MSLLSILVLMLLLCALTKHIGVDASFVRAGVQDHVIALQYVPSELQLADFFTKAQTRAQHGFFLSKLSVVNPV